MAATLEPETRSDHPDAPHEDDLDRYAIYVVNPAVLVNDMRGPHATSELSMEERGKGRRRVYETSLDGIGGGLKMLYDEDEIPRGWRVGVLDRRERFWLVNPFV